MFLFNHFILSKARKSLRRKKSLVLKNMRKNMNYKEKFFSYKNAAIFSIKLIRILELSYTLKQ